HDVVILFRHVRGRLGIHVFEILLDCAAAHSTAHDVQERQHARLGAVDHAVLEVGEIPPSGTAGIHDCRHARAERETVGIDAAVAVVDSGTVAARTGIDVHVHVDKAGRDVETGDIDDFVRLGRGDRGRHFGDTAVLDGDVAHGTDLVLAVDDVSPFEEKI